MNAASLYHSRFVVVAPSRTELRIRNDEVVGSIPTSSTNYRNCNCFPIAVVLANNLSVHEQCIAAGCERRMGGKAFWE